MFQQLTDCEEPSRPRAARELFNIDACRAVFMRVFRNYRNTTMVLYLSRAGGAKINTMKIIKSATMPPVERLRFVRQLREMNPKADPVALAAVEATALNEIEADAIRLHSLGIKWD